MTPTAEEILSKYRRMGWSHAYAENGISYELIEEEENTRLDPAKVIVRRPKKTKNEYIRDVKDLIFQHGLSLEDVMLDNYQDEEFRKQHGYGFHPISTE